MHWSAKPECQPRKSVIAARERRVVSLAATKDIGLGTKLAYGVGSIAYGAKVQILGALLFYYNQLEGLPAHWVNGRWAPPCGSTPSGTSWWARYPTIPARGSAGATPSCTPACRSPCAWCSC